MDIQLKRGFIEICVLSLLSKGDSYGYALIRDVSECVEISESTLYPILKRLEGANLLTVYTKEYNGRLRKYYTITDGGRKRLCEFPAEWQEMTKIYSFIKENSEEVRNG